MFGDYVTRHKGPLYVMRRLALRRRLAKCRAPKILVNTIPKSGTNVLTRCLNAAPGLYFDGRHIRNRWKTEHIEKALHAIRPGLFMSGHLEYTAGHDRFLKNLGIQVIQLVRDPRDVAVSHLHHILHRRLGKHSRLREYFHWLPDDEARLTAWIEGAASPAIPGGGQWPDARKRFDSYLDWVEHGACLVHFEKLIGPGGGGTIADQIREIDSLMRHLGIEVTHESLEFMAGNAFSRQSPTFRKGIVGEWRNYFTPELKDLFKEVTGSLLIRMGYEQGSDW